jgi:predicted deacylase
MKLIECGSGRPRVAVVGGIHGDEPAGEAIVETLIDTVEVDTGTVQLIVANEPALDAGKRYLQADLNRQFPGNEHSDEHECALAARLYAVLEGADATLALHTSRSAPPPFAIYSELTESVRRTVTGLPVEYVVDAGQLRSTTLDAVLPHTVSLEAGHQHSTEAVDFGLEAARAFLRVHGILDDEEKRFSETRIVEAHEEVPKGSGEPHIYYRNFEEVPVGEVFAHDDELTHRVEREGTVPILASEDGYDNIFGLYGSFEGALSPPGDD